VTRERLMQALAARPVIVEGKLDVAAFKAKIAEAARDELEYLASVSNDVGGRVVGLGGTGGGGQAVVERERLVQALRGLGLSETAAQAAAQAQGRG